MSSYCLHFEKYKLADRIIKRGRWVASLTWRTAHRIALSSLLIYTKLANEYSRTKHPLEKKILVSTTWNLQLESLNRSPALWLPKKRCIRAKTFVTDSWKSLWCSICTLHRFFLIKFIQMVIYSLKILSLTGWLLPENWPRHFKVEMPQACRSLSILAFEF